VAQRRVAMRRPAHRAADLRVLRLARRAQRAVATEATEASEADSGVLRAIGDLVRLVMTDRRARR